MAAKGGGGNVSGADPEEKSIFAQKKGKQKNKHIAIPILTTIISDVNKVNKCVVIPHDELGVKIAVSITGGNKPLRNFNVKECCSTSQLDSIRQGCSQKKKKKTISCLNPNI